MSLRPLGQTGILVSRLGFGAAPLGGGYGPVGAREATRAVHAALAAGWNFFDTAPLYGRGLSEERLGSALRGVARESCVLASKAGRTADGFDFSAKAVTRSVEESLRRLRTDYLDLVQCHDVEHADHAQIIGETLPALLRLRQAGKVRAVGVTAYPLRAIRGLMDATGLGCVLSHSRHTLHDTALAGLLPDLLARGLGVINAAPFAMGLLTAAGPPPWHPASAELRAAAREAAALCARHGTGLADCALHSALEHADLALCLVGISSAEEVRAAQRGLAAPPDAALLAQVRALFAGVKTRTWPSGRAENDDPASSPWLHSS